MSIIVENVTKLYGQQAALKGVSFEVKPGEIVGFLGPNGAGKSTMMKIITGFIPANIGHVRVCGLDVEKNPLLIKKKIGYLAEQNPLYYDLYVKEYLLFIAGLFKLKNTKERVNEMIKLVGLREEQHKKIGALSKGYKQRVGLAQALIHDPEVLILDEPTTGLDPNQLEEIRNLIKKIGQQKTVMLSTHIMQEVEAICDRVIIINKGEIVANDFTKNLSTVFQQKEYLLVEFDGETTETALRKINGLQSVSTEGNGVWKIQAEPNLDLRPVIFNWAVENKLSVIRLQKEEIKLENIFKQLTQSQEA